MNAKEKLLLEFLYQNRDKYVTSKEIAEHLETSDRTVRTYIKRIVSTDSLENNGFTIDSKQGSGYCLIVTDKNAYHRLVKGSESEETSQYAEVSDRHKWLLERLLLKEESILFDDLEEELYVSRSTLSNDFKKIRQLLEPYHLQIESKPHKGVYITGEERDKRHFIMDYFFVSNFKQNINHLMDTSLLDIPLKLETITQVVLDECRNAPLRLSDFVIQNVVVHIALAIQRVLDGFSLKPIYLDQTKFKKELDVARKIVDKLSQILSASLTIPLEEVDYITLHLITSSSVSSKELGDSSRLRVELLQALEFLDQKYGFGFAIDQNLIEGLLNHLQVLEERLENKIHLDNPLKAEIQQEYPEEFEETRDFLERISVFSTAALSDDEVAYVTLHLLASLERQKEKVKSNILVICSTGFGSSQMLKHRIENELGDLVNITDVISYYDLNKDILLDVDAIMTTIDLSNLIFNIPVLKVGVLLSEKEIREAKDLFSHLNIKAKDKDILLKNSGVGQESLKDIFERYFDDQRFLVFEDISKSTLLEKMVSTLSLDKGGEVELLHLMHSREKLSTVIFDKEIAVPHPLKPIQEKHEIVVAFVKNGVYWEDGFEKVQLVFLVSPSIYSNEGLKLIIDRIIGIVESPEIKARLLTSTDFQSFKEKFLD